MVRCEIEVKSIKQTNGSEYFLSCTSSENSTKLCNME